MISPLAYVDSAAKIGKNVTIQPFAFIEGNVEIGDDCIIMSGAKILHGTRMGKGNKVHHNAVLGAEPQDFHYTGESSMLISVIITTSARTWLSAVLPMQEALPASVMRTT